MCKAEYRFYLRRSCLFPNVEIVLVKIFETKSGFCAKYKRVIRRHGKRTGVTKALYHVSLTFVDCMEVPL